MLSHDARHGLRMLARSPGFTLAAVLTLAIGIGGNTAIFSAAEAIFLRPMPYPDADRLAYVTSSFPGNEIGGDNFSIPDFLDMRRESASFEALAAYYDWVGVSMTGSGEPVRLTANFVSDDYFPIFAARAETGRLFSPEENRLPDARPVAVLSHACWQARFGGDPGVVGRRVLLNETPVDVVGVMARDFRDIEETWRPEVDVWMPLGLSDRIVRQEMMANRAGRLFNGVGRLRAGVDAEAARGEASALARRLAEAFPETNRGYDLHVAPLRDHFVGRLYRPAALLVAGSLFVLLICCVNVANLLLVRVAGRRRELAVRAALGASRARLARQMLVECAMLSALGGALGLLFALWAVELLGSWDAIELPPFLEIGVNRWVLGASVLIAVATALLFGILPGLMGSRVDMRHGLGESGRQTAGSGRALERKALTVVEVALALVLLAGAGLTAKSFRALAGTGLGFDTESLLTARVDLRAERYSEEAARARAGARVVEAIEALPGVRSATLWGPGDLGRATWVMFVAPEGRAVEREEDLVMAHTHRVNPGGLGDLGIPVLRGRDFTEADRLDAERVAIVSGDLADALWPGEEPVGKRLWWQSRDAYLTVAGVAADACHRARFDLDHGAAAFEPQIDVYLPYAQSPNRALVIAVRTDGDPLRAEAAVREAVLSVDPDLPVYQVESLGDRLRSQEGPIRAVATLMGAYAAVALLLAGLGVYGVLSQAVGQRTRELGIRMAVGADSRRILALVLGQGAALVVGGLAAGLAASLATTRLIGGLLFGVSPTDPATFAAISLLLAAVAFVACYVPARRATRVDPITALRCE